MVKTSCELGILKIKWYIKNRLDIPMEMGGNFSKYIVVGLTPQKSTVKSI